MVCGWMDSSSESVMKEEEEEEEGRRRRNMWEVWLFIRNRAAQSDISQPLSRAAGAKRRLGKERGTNRGVPGGGEAGRGIYGEVVRVWW